VTGLCDRLCDPPPCRLGNRLRTLSRTGIDLASPVLLGVRSVLVREDRR
jgi:hypothetical protein